MYADFYEKKKVTESKTTLNSLSITLSNMETEFVYSQCKGGPSKACPLYFSTCLVLDFKLLLLPLISC